MGDRLYLDNPYAREFEASVSASRDGWCRLSTTVFYPGGGGQPHDRGVLLADGAALPVTAVRDDEGAVWHQVGRDLAAGTPVHGTIDWAFRYALMRAHALMHVVNRIARDAYGGAITGVQLGGGRSRIDFRLASFGREDIADFERRVNEVIGRDLLISSTTIGEDEFRRRPELVRTANVLPPVTGGRVRVVEIAGFDAQACGGTHVHSTREIGPARLARFDNKGKDNKRFYWDLVEETG